MRLTYQLAALRANLKPDYLAALLERGTVSGGYLMIDAGAMRELKARHEPVTVAPTPLRGLGDVVARVAKPIARMIDATLRTHLEDCKGCDKRQSALNKRFPYL